MSQLVVGIDWSEEKGFFTRPAVIENGIAAFVDRVELPDTAWLVSVLGHGLEELGFTSHHEEIVSGKMKYEPLMFDIGLSGDIFRISVPYSWVWGAVAVSFPRYDHVRISLVNLSDFEDTALVHEGPVVLEPWEARTQRQPWNRRVFCG